MFYYGDWIRKPGVAICSCNDGLRPVIFKIEVTEEESQIDYVPVRQDIRNYTQLDPSSGTYQERAAALIKINAAALFLYVNVFEMCG